MVKKIRRKKVVLSKKRGKVKRRIKVKRGNGTGKIILKLSLKTLLVALVAVPCLLISDYLHREKWEVVGKKLVVATAYSSTVDQTDSTPCITANGFNLCENGKEEIIANNGLKFGTKVRIPALFGDRVFTVSDRMNARYGGSRIDIWMDSREDATNFGVRKAEMEIVKEKE